MARDIPWPHPGETLLHEFMEPMGLTQYRLAKEIGVSQRCIGEIVAGARSITVDTGLRLSKFFGTSDGFWTRLQFDHDTAVVKEQMAEVLGRIRRFEQERS
ncbi:MAG: addiction module antidote protein, HigA family [Comamonas sp. SCN 65-56]|uniref:HigA family addiction module antitoxin n=1 Tax=Comamonas sp. SCN 65-56 TaxID=1660095 RepID=UPI00086B3F54|nr:HigA family addiction module antitoxin [Comamonas sp. SCN 65-56]ODS92418.1 MAG: addiction module antidote protein, HigA family [Comamonas sp. SCN 65-56]